LPQTVPGPVEDSSTTPELLLVLSPGPTLDAEVLASRAPSVEDVPLLEVDDEGPSSGGVTVVSSPQPGMKRPRLAREIKADRMGPRYQRLCPDVLVVAFASARGRR